MFARTVISRALPRQARSYATQQPPKPAGKPINNAQLFFGALIGSAAVMTAIQQFTGTDAHAAKEHVKEEVKKIANPNAEPALKGDGKWVPLKLASVEDVTPTTKKFRFELPESDQVSGLKITSAVLTKFKPEGKEKFTLRPYTPVNDESDVGHLDLLVKKYPGGPMSTHIHSLQPGQVLEFKGPLPKYPYSANMHEQLTLIAGGTGIAPMYQLIRAVFNNPEDKTAVTLVLGNVSEDEILLKKELDHLATTYPRRFTVKYLLDKAAKDEGWATTGYVTKEILKTVLPEPGSKNQKIFVCGPPGMYAAVSGGKVSPTDQGDLTGILKELGYTKEDVFKF
ncbi:ferredoxin reductase-like protein [Ascobolus immersus RN42]|uniref:NADH-cytochrome b5 reductase 2 n=1 Tax=Ascobolus immersus RN42 TaxID=1160509 RepID=A0A3N4I3E3_ASCIM|nr:ferredoxin reductase-like protein [Ascobolus immersus RN42]